MLQIYKPIENQSLRLISPRELQILMLISEEFTTKEIAAELFISEQTVATHRKNMMHKMQVKNVAGLVRKSFESGILHISKRAI